MSTEPSFAKRLVLLSPRFPNPRATGYLLGFGFLLNEIHVRLLHNVFDVFGSTGMSESKAFRCNYDVKYSCPRHALLHGLVFRVGCGQSTT